MKGEEGRPAIHRECRLQKSSVNDIIGHEKKLKKPTPFKVFLNEAISHKIDTHKNL